MGLIIGIDEVGRGCLFGPVVASAVAFKPGALIPDGLTDSKKLTAKKRKEFSTVLMRDHYCGTGMCSPEEVDEINILQASLLAMKRACELLIKQTKGKFDIEDVRIDGIWKIPGLDEALKQTTIVKGDLHDEAIGAASIVAKVFRDEMMEKAEEFYPGYGLSKHKGYPTKAHKEALIALGVSDQHRRSFKGVKELV
jgi:ribonuclease HII